MSDPLTNLRMMIHQAESVERCIEMVEVWIQKHVGVLESSYTLSDRIQDNLVSHIEFEANQHLEKLIAREALIVTKVDESKTYTFPMNFKTIRKRMWVLK